MSLFKKIIDLFTDFGFWLFLSTLSIYAATMISLIIKAEVAMEWGTFTWLTISISLVLGILLMKVILPYFSVDAVERRRPLS